MEINKQEAKEFILKCMAKDKAFDGIEKEDLDSITGKIIDKDMEYLDSVEEVYDEDLAFDFIFESLTKGQSDETKMLISVILDGYFEYFDTYLEENNLIDWV